MKKYSIVILILISSLTQAQFITNNGIQLVNSAKVTTNGDWTNSSGTSVTNDGTIATTESWTNNGTVNGAGTFVVNFAADKNFSSGKGTFGTLIKTGAGAALVAGSLHVADSLLLNNGLVKLGATDTLLIDDGIVMASPGSYVEGMIAHAGTGDKIFPFGRDGNFLPLTLVKFNASKATASVSAAPAGYTAGPAVEALINFPYVWKVVEKTAADTSAYVEITYPNSLPTATNPIVARAVTGNKYLGMGARAITNNSNTVTVRSYSRGLVGTYTIAKGFPGNFKTDSLALVALYNNTAGAGWTNKTNWLSKPLSDGVAANQWAGVTVVAQSITAVNLPNNKLTGPVPDQLVDILSLQTINLSGNAITFIPNFTDNKQVTTLNVSSNKLDFASLEPNVPLINKAGVTFSYANQADIGTPKTTQIDVGKPYSFLAQVGGEKNTYQWKRNGTAINGATTNKYEIAAIGRTNMGQHQAEIKNSIVPGLTLRTAIENAQAIASLEGKLFANANTGASKGKMMLFKVNQGTAYDTIAVQNVKNDGTYKLEKVVLDDYQLLGFADTVVHTGALPTYYQNTIYWEEANTIPVNENKVALNITANYKPTGVAKGAGVISGFLEEPTTGGRAQASKRVAGAGASVRRVENVGKPTAEKLTLVAYVYTNDQGEFVIPELTKGEYRLNIQYPGYPMDETSYVTIPIGDGLQSQVRVAANVAAGKIKVDKLVVTGLWEQEGYVAEVFPNPTVSTIQIRFGKESTERSVHLTDATGRGVITKSAQASEEVIDVSHLASGIYILRVQEGTLDRKAIRVVVQKD